MALLKEALVIKGDGSRYCMLLYHLLFAYFVVVIIVFTISFSILFPLIYIAFSCGLRII